VACVFTSGSTGTPVPHRKTWGNLARNVRVEAGRLQLHDGRSHCVVATVPVQHMYGFETSLLMPLQSGQAFAAERPFFPADIASTLAAVPRPRMLTSTPLHLNALLGAGIELPAVDLIVCATALLDAANARDIESRFGAPLMEIYGSTETGQIASRRTTATSEWQLWPGVRLETKEDRTWAAGGTIAEPTLLGDVVQSIDADRFYLHGRTEDLVNIAGKRSSLAYLSHQLNSIPGVTDGAFFLPIEGGERAGLRTTRLGAIAVAPRLTPDSILRELRLRIDPVFLPRPLRLVDRIPRNTTGKLRRADLDVLVARGGAAKAQVDLHIAADHPAFEGHFPGLPLVPGAVLLDEIVRTIVAAHGLSSRQCTIPSAKFKRIVRPGDALTLAFEFTGPAAIHFELTANAELAAEGTLRLPYGDAGHAD
jgi:acyl-coenzyme A synthetase/AMP-(fatty) acid ligase